jgi:hypothetical protein
MPVKVLEITPNSLLYNEKYKDDLKVWTVASKNANGMCLVCNCLESVDPMNAEIQAAVVFAERLGVDFRVICNVIIAAENHLAESMKTLQKLCRLTWSPFTGNN